MDGARVSSLWHRLARDVAVAWMLVRNGLTPTSVLLFPIRKRLVQPRTRLDHRDGTTLLAGPDDDICLLVQEVWIERCYETARHPIPSTGAIVDVGANVGTFALWAARHRPGCALICVEPSPRALEYLRANLTRNAVHGATVIAAACGAPGRAMLWAGERSSGDTLHPLDGVENRRLGEVDVLDLGQVLAQAAPTGPVWLKLDCEGAEREVIEHASDAALDRVTGIALEFHSDRAGCSLDELCTLLERRGFAVERVRRPPDGPDVCDYLFAGRR